jgi:hypothetical protein
MKKVWGELVGYRPRNEGGCGVSPWFEFGRRRRSRCEEKKRSLGPTGLLNLMRRALFTC